VFPPWLQKIGEPGRIGPVTARQRSNKIKQRRETLARRCRQLNLRATIASAGAVLQRIE